MIKKLIAHKDKIYLMQLAILQVLISFTTNFLIVKKIGFGSELDVFYIAMGVFAFLFTSIGWSISSVLTPILIENREKKLEGKLFLNILIITIPIFIIAIISMFFWSKLIFINYLDMVDYTKILVVQGMFIVTFLFSTLNVLFYAIFQERNQYIKINCLNILGAIVGLVFVYSTIDNYGIYSASMGQVIVQLFLFLIMGILSFGTVKQSFEFDKENFNLLWKRMRYLFIGSFYYRTDELIERFIASYLTPGFLSLIGFIQRIYGAIITVLNSSISGPTITKFSNLLKEGQHNQVKKILYKYLLFLFVVDSMLFIIVLLFGESLFLHFFKDRIEEQLLTILYSSILFLFAIVFGKTLGQILHNLLLSMKLEKKITIYDSVSFTINIFIKIIATVYFGMLGLLFAIVFSEILKNSLKTYIVLQNIRTYNAT